LLSKERLPSNEDLLSSGGTSLVAGGTSSRGRYLEIDSPGRVSPPSQPEISGDLRLAGAAGAADVRSAAEPTGDSAELSSLSRESCSPDCPYFASDSPGSTMGS